MPSAPRFLTLADVAEVLSTSSAQVYALVRRGELPAIKIGGRGQWRVESTQLEAYIERTVGIVTALNPVIGYEKATELAAEAYESGKGILEIVREKKILTEDEIEDLLDPEKLTGLDPSMYKTKR